MITTNETQLDFISGNIVNLSDNNDTTLYHFSGNAILKNNTSINRIVVLAYPLGNYLNVILPDVNGNYQCYLNKGSEYIFVFIGPVSYKPESYYYKAPL